MSLLVECVAGSRWVIPSVKKLRFSKIKSTKRFPTHLRFSLLLATFILIAAASLFITHTELPPPLSTTMSVTCTTPCEGDPPKDPLSIPEDEADLVLLSNPSDTDEDDLSKRMFARKILAPKPLNKSGVRNAFKSLWEDFGEITMANESEPPAEIPCLPEDEAEPMFIPNFLIAIMVSTRFGSQRFMVDQWGDLTPPTP